MTWERNLSGNMLMVMLYNAYCIYHKPRNNPMYACAIHNLKDTLQKAWRSNYYIKIKTYVGMHLEDIQYWFIMFSSVSQVHQ